MVGTHRGDTVPGGRPIGPIRETNRSRTCWKRVLGGGLDFVYRGWAIKWPQYDGRSDRSAWHNSLLSSAVPTTVCRYNLYWLAGPRI